MKTLFVSVIELTSLRTMVRTSILRSVAMVMLAVTFTTPVSGWQVSLDQSVSREQLFLFSPETPEELIDAVITADRLERWATAQSFLRSVLDRKLSPDELLNLRKKFGIGQFLVFNANSNLQPEAGELLLAINVASQSGIPTEEAMAAAVRDLGNNGAVRDDAVRLLMAAGASAVPALLSAPDSSAEGTLARRILSRNAREMRYGMLRALSGATEADRVLMIRLLGGTADRRIAYSLYRWRFGEDVSSLVTTAAEKAIIQLSAEGTVPKTSDVAGAILKAVMREQLAPQHPRQINRYSSADRDAETSFEVQMTDLRRLASDSLTLDPDDEEFQAIHLAVLAALHSWYDASRTASSSPDSSSEDGSSTEFSSDEELAALETELQQPADQHVILLSLSESLTAENSFAASGILKLMISANIKPEELSYASSLIDAAMNSTDSRIRTAAAKVGAVNKHLSCNDQRVTEIIESVLAGSSEPEAVLIDTDNGRLNELAPALEDAGYTVAAARTSVIGFETAIRQLNCDLIMIHSNCLRWELSQAVANLRADVRTRRTPIVVFGPATSEAKVRSLQARYPEIWYLSEPLGMLTLSDRLRFEGVPAPNLSSAERAALKKSVTDAITGHSEAVSKAAD
jgi:hypothetical protein